MEKPFLISGIVGQNAEKSKKIISIPKNFFPPRMLMTV
jgi:hypothetical protein